MNSKQLDKKLKELEARQKQRRSALFDSSDHTRDVAGSIQNGLYYGQLALGVFRSLSNYHLPPKKRVRNVLITISGLILGHFIRKFIINRKSNSR